MLQAEGGCLLPMEKRLRNSGIENWRFSVDFLVLCEESSWALRAQGVAHGDLLCAGLRPLIWR